MADSTTFYIFLIIFLGKEISGYDHFRYCGREEEEFQLARMQDPVPAEEIATEREDQKANPTEKQRAKLCPRCRRRCLKENSNNNHIKCWNCKADFCYQCGKEIKGAVTLHFTAASSCRQHTDD